MEGKIFGRFYTKILEYKLNDIIITEKYKQHTNQHYPISSI